MASIKPEFDKRGVKIIGLSVDSVDKHPAWADDIEETQGTAPNYPLIGDEDFAVSKAYGMLPADVSGDADRPHAGGQPDRAQRVHRRAGQEGQADPHLPDDHGAQLRRGAPGDRLPAAHRQPQGGHRRRSGSRATTSSSPARRPTTPPRRSSAAGTSPSPTSGSCPSHREPAFVRSSCPTSSALARRNRYDADEVQGISNEGAPLLARYDLDEVRAQVTREEIAARLTTCGATTRCCRFAIPRTSPRSARA